MKNYLKTSFLAFGLGVSISLLIIGKRGDAHMATLFIGVPLTVIFYTCTMMWLFRNENKYLSDIDKINLVVGCLSKQGISFMVHNGKEIAVHKKSLNSAIDTEKAVNQLVSVISKETTLDVRVGAWKDNYCYLSLL